MGRPEHHHGDLDERTTDEVVAGLANDGSAKAVAEAAVAVAREVGASRVRFVQVVVGALTDEARAEVETEMFSIALRALHGRPRLQATFEAPVGKAPARLLVDRSREAIRLVIGADKTQPTHEVAVAAYCLAHAGCPVHVVPAVSGSTPTGGPAPDPRRG